MSRRAALAVGWVLMAMAAGLLVPGSATAATAAPDPVVLTVRSMTASGVDPIVFTGQATNASQDTLRDLRVQLRVAHDPLGSRGALADYAQSTDPSPGSSVDGALATVAPSLAPGESAPWRLSVPAARLGLGTGFGVYPIALDLRGELPSGSRASLAMVRTFLPWGDSGGTVLPTKLALVVPVVAPPTRDAAGAGGGAVLTDLLTGRLQTLLNAAAGHRVTYALDGDLLEAAQADTVDATGPAWLAALTAQLPGSDVMALPYADPDLVATTRSGHPGDITLARKLGVAAVRAALPPGTDIGADLAWPADGTLDVPTRAAVKLAGFTSLLLSDRYSPTVATTTYTASAVGPLGATGITAVASDGVLSALIATPVSRQGGSVVARQRFLAELAMITAEEPSVQRSVVVTPPRDWAPAAAYIHGLLQSVDDSGFAQLATLPEIRADAGVTGPPRRTPTFPSALANALIDPAQMATVSRAHDQLSTLSAVLTVPAPIVDPLMRGILRAESASWRDAAASGRIYAQDVLTTVTATQAKVHLVGSGAITLSGQSGRIPVTVANDLDQPVNVRVLLRAVPAIRLTLTEPGAVTIGAGERQTIEVAAQAAGNGAVDVRVTLTTPDGAEYGAPVSFPVQVTGLGAVASAVVGGALALLAIALVVRIGRAVRQGRRPGSDASVREKANTP